MQLTILFGLVTPQYHLGGDDRPPTTLPFSPTSREDLRLDDYFRVPRTAKAQIIYKHPCLFRDSNTCPTTQHLTSLTTIPDVLVAIAAGINTFRRILKTPDQLTGETKTKHACPTPNKRKQKATAWKPENESKHEVNFKMEGPRSQQRWRLAREGVLQTRMFCFQTKVIKSGRDGNPLTSGRMMLINTMAGSCVC
ncbi:hypothetical protein TNCV_3850401 [Trichonephila clavipes]|nr:hypothetical protein TNCV_3850401 [Trichonephila clavipes]